MGTRAGHEDELFVNVQIRALWVIDIPCVPLIASHVSIAGSGSLGQVSGCDVCCHKQGLELVFGFCWLLRGDQAGVWPCRVAWAAPWAVLASP